MLQALYGSISVFWGKMGRFSSRTKRSASLWYYKHCSKQPKYNGSIKTIHAHLENYHCCEYNALLEEEAKQKPTSQDTSKDSCQSLKELHVANLLIDHSLMVGNNKCCLFFCR